jgi:mannose-6-phosphate isomerase-like protein (cupin superfamily)
MTQRKKNIENATIRNQNYRSVFMTGKHLQVVLMCLVHGEEVPFEIHRSTDQFIRVEHGDLTILIKGESDRILHEGDSFLIEAGKHHQLSNHSGEDVKFYTIYSSVEHGEHEVTRRNK